SDCSLFHTHSGTRVIHSFPTRRSSDLNNRGFVFDNLEEWMPTKILKTQEEFFEKLIFLLESEKDVDEAKRRMLKGKFFKYHDNQDRKSTRLNSSHVSISYAVFCLKKKS